MTTDELLAAARTLRVHKHHEVRAPYKALTLLWTVGRSLRGQVRVEFVEAEAELGAILQPHRVAGSPPEARYPFFHLGSEAALWRVCDAAGEDLWHKVRHVEGGRRPTAARMREEAAAELSPDLNQALRDTDFRSAFIRKLLSEWPLSQWDSVLSTVGLEPDVIAPSTA